MKAPQNLIRAIIGFNFLLLFGNTLFAQEELDKLRAAFLETRQNTFSTQKTFDDSYDAQLDALLKKAQDSGNLDSVVEIKGEKAHFRDASAADPIKDPQLLKIHDLYINQNKKLRDDRIKSWDGIYSAYLKKLAEYRAASTKADRIDDALKADQEIKNIEKEISDLKASVTTTPSASGGEQSELKSEQVIGEWQYKYNGRTWRRIFTPDGKIELWLEGNRDGSWLSDIHWKAENKGIVNGVWLYKGDKEFGRVKLKDGGKVMKWEGGPDMVKMDSKDVWKKK